jgi:hypothetical protein
MVNAWDLSRLDGHRHSGIALPADGKQREGPSGSGAGVSGCTCGASFAEAVRSLLKLADPGWLVAQAMMR